MEAMNIDAGITKRLTAIAEGLLWDGEDRAADAIYAVIQAETEQKIIKPMLRLAHNSTVPTSRFSTPT